MERRRSSFLIVSVAFVLVLVSLVTSVEGQCAAMEVYNKDPTKDEWQCLPCFNSTGICQPSESSGYCQPFEVEGCELPEKANWWACCQNCGLSGADLCLYKTPEPSHGGCGPWCISAIVFAALIVVSLVGGLAFWIIRKKQRQVSSEEDLDDMPFSINEDD